MKLWAGRFIKETDKQVELFTSSIDFDKRLYKHDIEGSIAHTRMLAKLGIISMQESEQIIAALTQIRDEISQGCFDFKAELEDIHMHIEQALIEKIGETGGKLHTARSRNDQVALDTRLYLREEINNIIKLLQSLQRVIIEKAEANLEVIMPGYTHLQHAEPILFSHHLMAYFWMLQRDVDRLLDGYKRVNIMPLGACALAGTSLPIDRQYLSECLDFPQITENSIDTVSDRDYILEFLSAASLIMMHLSRLSEELILWSSQEFGFIELDDAFCTGSSIMPQKKNPDVCELIRGKTGRIYGHLFSLLTTMKGLPLAYNRDMQEDKEPLFDTVDTLKLGLSIYAQMLTTMKIYPDRTRSTANKDSFVAATHLANYLVERYGLPFREAHTRVGQLVSYAINQRKGLDELAAEEVKMFIPQGLPEAGIDAWVVIQAKRSEGSTSTEKVLEQLKKAYLRL